MTKELLQYNVDYDRNETDRVFLMTQLETHLRERFNVLISTVEYEIVDGHLARPGKTEPFINSIKRGKDIVQHLSTNTVDFERENAEVRGFGGEIDPTLADSSTSLGTKFLSISLNGGDDSKYQHNFYDIFTLKRRDGKRYVEMSRYSSALDSKDYAARLPGFDPENPPSAAQFLANPILIENVFITGEQIHQMLHEHHNYMTPADFSEIWSEVKVSPFVQNYLVRKDGRSFNAILNFADEVCENLKRKRASQTYRDFRKDPIVWTEIRGFEEKEVRQVAGDCPGKSGADRSSVYSVSDFDKFGYEFDQPGPCKKCGADVNCGPCGICKACDLRIRKEQGLKVAA